MAFIAVATTVGTTIGLGTGIAATIGGGALIGAGVGGLYSGITGDGDILNSMLTGGLIGGFGGALGGAMFPGAAGITPAATTSALGSGSALASQAAAPAATAVNTVTPAMQAAALDAAAVAEGSTVAGMVPAANTGLAANTVIPASMQLTAPAAAAAGPSGMKMLGYGLAGTTALSLLGGKQKGPGAGTMPDPGTIRPFEYSSTPTTPTGDYPSPYATARYETSGNPILDTRERNYFTQDFAAMQPYSAKTGAINPNVPLPSSNPITAAGGGVMKGYDDELGGDYSAMGMDQGNMQKGLFGMGYANGGRLSEFIDIINATKMKKGGSVKKYSFGGLALIENLIRQAEQGQMPKYQFDQGTQRYNTVNQPTMGAVPSLGGYRFDPNTDRYETSSQPMAAGGMTGLGGYSDGGRMLKGPGDGMSDSIPGVIGNKQPARLADGEFVVPADVVSHLGNGSTDAGAKRLYAMMDKVRKARTGNKKQGKQIKAEKYLPA